MSKIEAMIEQALAWREEHMAAAARQPPTDRHRSVDAWACHLRIDGLIDAYEALGGDGSQWRKQCGALQ